MNTINKISGCQPAMKLNKIGRFMILSVDFDISIVIH